MPAPYPLIPAPYPLIPSLSRDALASGAWFDRVTMSGFVVAPAP